MGTEEGGSNAWQTHLHSNDLQVVFMTSWRTLRVLVGQFFLNCSKVLCFKCIFLLECFIIWTKDLDACMVSYDRGFLLVCISPDLATAAGLLFWLTQLIQRKGS